MKKIFILKIVLLKALSAQSVPMLINYQAKLIDNSNNPIVGTVSLTFRLYDNIDGGNELWSETHNSIESNNGIVGVLLGSLTEFTPYTFSNSSVFLETEVTGYGILEPRQQLTSVPYAIKAENTLSLMHHTTTSLQPEVENTGQSEIVFDTTFVLTKHEFLKVDMKVYSSGFLQGSTTSVYFGTVGNENSFGSIIDPNTYPSYPRYYPHGTVVIPIQSDWVGEDVRLYIKTSNDSDRRGYVKQLSIWGK